MMVGRQAHTGVVRAILLTLFGGFLGFELWAFDGAETLRRVVEACGIGALCITLVCIALAIAGVGVVVFFIGSIFSWAWHREKWRAVWFNLRSAKATRRFSNSKGKTKTEF